MSDTPKLDFEERQRAQQVYEECCENPEDFAYKFVAMQSELAAANKRIAELEQLVNAICHLVRDRAGWLSEGDAYEWLRQEISRHEEFTVSLHTAEPSEASAVQYTGYEPKTV